MTPPAALERVIAFPRYLARRFAADDGMRAASALSFATALALIPILAIGLAMFAAFPAFDDVRVQMMLFVFENLSPSLGPQIQGVIEGFVNNAGGLTGFGAIGLAATAVLLLNTIQRVFSRIWREEKPVSLLRRAPVYWMLLTFGPIFIGAALSMSSQLPALLVDVDEIAPPGLAQRAGSIGLTFLAFLLLYRLMPQTRVALKDAAIGAMFAALAFAVARAGFGLYVAMFPTYEAIYGALAALPVTLIWIYLSWTVTIMGAEIAAAAPEWRAGAGRETRKAGTGASRGRRLAAALDIVERLHAAEAFAAPADDGSLAAAARLDDSQAAAAVTIALAEAGVIGRLENGGWALLRDPTVLTLGDLLAALDMDLDGVDHPGVAKLRRAEAPVLATPIASIR